MKILINFAIPRPKLMSILRKKSLSPLASLVRRVIFQPVNEMPREDDGELRERLTRLLASLQNSKEQNPATLEALLHAFPELTDTELTPRRTLITKLKQRLDGTKAA